MNDRKTVCRKCNAVIDEDGTTLDCTGECGRQRLVEFDAEQPLNFDERPTTQWGDDAWDGGELVGDLFDHDLDYPDDDGEDYVS